MEEHKKDTGIIWVIILVQLLGSIIVLGIWSAGAGFWDEGNTLLATIAPDLLRKGFIMCLVGIPLGSLLITFVDDGTYNGHIFSIVLITIVYAGLFFYFPLLFPLGIFLQLTAAFLWYDAAGFDGQVNVPLASKKRYVIGFATATFMTLFLVLRFGYFGYEVSVAVKLLSVFVIACVWQTFMQGIGGNIFLGGLLLLLGLIGALPTHLWKVMLPRALLLPFQLVCWFYISLGTAAIFNVHRPKRIVRFKKHGRAIDRSALTLPYLKGGWLNIVDWTNHVLLVGGSGFGKTTLLKHIAVHFIKHERCGIIVDYKQHDIAEVAYKAYLGKRPKDYCFYHLSFHDPAHSMGCNPLLEIKHMADARLIAQVLHQNLSRQEGKGNSYFADSAEGLLAGIIYFLKMDYPDYCSIPHLVRLVCHYELDQVLPLMAVQKDIQPLMSDIRSCLKHGAGEQASGTLGKLRSFLAKIDDHTVMYLFTRNDFSLELNSKKKEGGILAIGCNEDMQPVYSPLIATVVSMAMNKMRNRGQRAWFVLFEELSKYIIPGLNHILTTVREGGGSIVAALQNSHTYGTVLGATAEEFFQGFYNLIVMNSRGKSASEMSGIFGKEEIDDISRTKQKGGDKESTTTRKTERPRVTVGAFSDLEKGEVIASTQTKEGVRCLSKGRLRYKEHPTAAIGLFNDDLSFESTLLACQEKIIREVEQIITDAKEFNRTTAHQ